MKNIGEEFRINFSKLREIWRNPKLSSSAKVILLDLLFYAGVDGESFPSQELLAKNHGFKDTRQIRNLIKELRRYGINWERGGFGRSNRYFFSEEIYYRNDSSDRKNNSSNSGNEKPVENGNILPSNINQESNQLSSTVQQLFEKTSKRRCDRIDLHLLNKLCKKYPEDWMIDAIKEAGSRNYPYIKVNLISLILDDWKKLGGKPPPKPEFIPCGKEGCENGYIYSPDGHEVSTCICRENYEKELEDWKEQLRGYHV